MHFFPEYKCFGIGVQVFAPEDPGAFERGDACKGFGMIRYQDGSVFYGDVCFDGTRYHRIGFGRQDFLLSHLGVFNPEHKVRRAFYIGQFDYRKTDWIYGNGAMFYVDADNKPAYFVKGFYEGEYIFREYQGDFDSSILPNGFTVDMEAFFDPFSDVLQQKMRAISGVKKLENLFIGDSYFELWNNPAYAERTFYEIYQNEYNLNLGVGGTCFCNWLRFVPAVKTLPEPKRIFLNLGFNDIHRHQPIDSVFANFIQLMTILQNEFPNSEYYLLNVVQCPRLPEMAEIEEEFNSMTLASAKKYRLKIIDMRSAIQAVGGTEKAFVADNLHLNPIGYSAMEQEISKIIF